MTADIKKYNFKTGLSQEFEIVDIGLHYDEKKDMLTTIHRVGFYQVLWFQNGNSTHMVDFNPVEVTANTLLFLNKDVINSFDHNKRFECKALIFTDSFFCKTPDDMKFLKSTVLFNDLFSLSKIQLEKQKSILFNELLQGMTKELQNKKDLFQSDILRNLLHNFLLLSERERRQQDFIEIKAGIDLDLIIQLKELLEINFKVQKQVAFYTGEMLVSEKRLNQVTTKMFGKTPKEIIDDRIMLEAKRILAYSTESVKEIGYSLGFEEPTYFIKYFRKHSHCTPIKFREKALSA